MSKIDAKISLLSNEDLYGNTELKILNSYGKKALLTDFAILTGADFNSNAKFTTSKKECLYNAVAFYSRYNINSFSFLNSQGLISSIDEDGKYMTTNTESLCQIRPVLEIPNFDTIFKSHKYNMDNISYKWIPEIVEYLYYPQSAPSKLIQTKLEEEYINNKLLLTNKKIIINNVNWESDSQDFKPFIYYVYEYQGLYFIRVKANTEVIEELYFGLSNGESYKNGEYVWIEVEPVIWLVDTDTKKLISERILLGGVNYLDQKHQDAKDYSSSFLKKYLEEYMLPDLTQEYKLSRQTKLEEKNVIKEINPYGLKFDKVSEEEIIRGAIESGVAVFLHGPSSEGKSARVKQIDPDCKIIYLRNASPDSLNGKSVYNSETGEMIDVKPSWLKQLEEKCESEPDKLHVVFFDEITNALPSIQGIAFNIVLDREVNGIWKLPENARIVASGNEMKDSLASNQLAEPLFNRFAHVYIKTTVESWLKWASENGIHPAIYTFVAYKRGEVLRSEYNGERPNADPRKWEMASKMLYATSNPEMIRSLVGEEITNEFVAFCKTKVITVEDVINDNYEKEDLRSLNTSERYATVMCLSQVSEEHIEKVRNFVTKLGGEYRSIFDTLWIQNKPERLEIIAELSQEIDTCEVIDEMQIGNADIEISLLSVNDIKGNKKLEILEKYGSIALATDLVILTGGITKHGNYSPILGKYIGGYFTKTSDSDGDVKIVNFEGIVEACFKYKSYSMIRPVLLLSGMFSEITKNKYKTQSGYEVEFGEYPQYAVDSITERTLEKSYKAGELRETGHIYEINDSNNSDGSFNPIKYPELCWCNRTFIRVKSNFYNSAISELSNGRNYKRGEYVWVEVKPVKWLIDEEKRILISEFGLISGIRFQDKKIPYNGNFKETEMYDFLNNHFLPNIMQSYKIEKSFSIILKK